MIGSVWAFSFHKLRFTQYFQAKKHVSPQAEHGNAQGAAQQLRSLTEQAPGSWEVLHRYLEHVLPVPASSSADVESQLHKAKEQTHDSNGNSASVKPSAEDVKVGTVPVSCAPWHMQCTGRKGRSVGEF